MGRRIKRRIWLAIIMEILIQYEIKFLWVNPRHSGATN